MTYKYIFKLILNLLVLGRVHWVTHTAAIAIPGTPEDKGMQHDRLWRLLGLHPDSSKKSINDEII